MSQAKGVSGMLSLSDGSSCATTPSGIVRPDCRLFVDFRNRAELRNLLRMPYAAAVSEPPMKRVSSFTERYTAGVYETSSVCASCV